MAALQRGIVKQVLSGDTVIIRGQPKGGPPPERTLSLSNITAPRLARRANPNLPNSEETKDEPFAWEAREFLRKKLVGKEVCFTVEYKVPGSGREYGIVYLGKDASAENITESLVTAGLVDVRSGGIKPSDEQHKLCDLENTTKAQGVGKWGENPQTHVRGIVWSLENPRHFVDSHHGKPVKAIIEHVRDACTVRAFVLPTFHHITVMMSGIKGPMFRREGEDNKEVGEAFADEAKFFTECRLLQRDVEIILEGVSNQNLLGTIIHPAGSIAELLLTDGFARCVDWSMGVVSQGAEKLRSAEKIAKEKRLRIWKDHKPQTSSVNISEKTYTAKVVECVNGDALVVKMSSGESKKIFLASIRPPRSSDAATAKDDDDKNRPRSRPLYDIPYMFEAREFSRKKLVGKKVNVQVDYIQPARDGFPEKTCCTVTIGGINVAETLVSKGLAKVIRYRQDDDSRSAHYDELLASEARAEKKAVGMWSKKETPIHRVADISGDVSKAKQFLPFLQRAGRSEAIVEFVASGSRLRLYMPRETCLVTFLLAGISCPRGSRPAPGPGGHIIEGEPYGEEAQQFTRELCLQREVEVQVESMDKAGNFIGWLFIDGVNLSLALVEEGLSSIHFTAERSNYFSILQTAEARAKQDKKNIWKNYEEPKDTVEVDDGPTERKVNYKTVVITECRNEELKFYAQNVDHGPKLEQLMDDLRKEFQSNPPLTGSYTPKKGDLCAAKFVDDEWYRAKVEKVDRNGAVNIFYVDYGNREVTSSSRLAVLPGAFNTLPAQAKEYTLACVKLPSEPDAIADAINAFKEDTANRNLLLNTEYLYGGVESVSLAFEDTKEDVGKGLVSDGLVLVDERREKRLAKLMLEYKKAQDNAKSNRLNMWRYGDFTEDECREFGMGR